MATEQTRHEAADPQTSPNRLQELTSDPELWALIAANPSAYDSLVAWLGENGGDDVRAAIARRASTATPTTVMAGGLTPPPTAPTMQAPAAQRSGGSNKGLWITLGVLVVLLLTGGIGAGVWALTKDDDSTTTADDDDKKSDTDDRKTNTDDEKDDDQKKDDEPADLDCDDLSDLEDAADDLTYYLPSIDEKEDLEDAVAEIEQFADYDDEDVVEIVEALLTYADAVAEDDDAATGPEWEEAINAKFELMDYVFEEC